jgi:nucleoside-triphosphatase THEP1
MIPTCAEGYRSPPVFLLTGPLQGGKTSCLRDILCALDCLGIRYAGFISNGLMENGIRTGFTLEDLSTGTSAPLCGTVPGVGLIRWGRFFFTKSGIEAGCKALSYNGSPYPDLTVVDEVGPFELRGGVWAQKLDEMTFRLPRPLLWVVREALVKEVIEKWQFPDPQVLTIPLNADVAAGVIAKKIAAWKQSRPEGMQRLRPESFP